MIRSEQPLSKRRVFAMQAACLFGIRLALSMPMAVQAEPIDVIDIAGRTVTVEKGVQRVILGEERMIYSVAVLDRKEPFQRIIGWKDVLI